LASAYVCACVCVYMYTHTHVKRICGSIAAAQKTKTKIATKESSLASAYVCVCICMDVHTHIRKKNLRIDCHHRTHQDPDRNVRVLLSVSICVCVCIYYVCVYTHTSKEPADYSPPQKTPRPKEQHRCHPRRQHVCVSRDICMHVYIHTHLRINRCRRKH